MPLDITRLGSFEVLSDHGETTENDVSYFKETRTSLNAEVLCGRSLTKKSMATTWEWRHEQSHILQQAVFEAQIVPKSVSSEKGCLSVNLFFCVSQIGGFSTNIFYQLQFSKKTSPAWENVDWTNYQLKSSPVTISLMKNGCRPEHSHDQQLKHVHRQQIGWNRWQARSKPRNHR